MGFRHCQTCPHLIPPPSYRVLFSPHSFYSHKNNKSFIRFLFFPLISVPVYFAKIHRELQCGKIAVEVSVKHERRSRVCRKQKTVGKKMKLNSQVWMVGIEVSERGGKERREKRKRKFWVTLTRRSSIFICLIFLLSCSIMTTTTWDGKEEEKRIWNGTENSIIITWIFRRHPYCRRMAVHIHTHTTSSMWRRWLNNYKKVFSFFLSFNFDYRFFSPLQMLSQSITVRTLPPTK